MLIKYLLKIIIVCIIMINFVFSINIDALPKGVERVSIENWKKTREINEVEGDERKLNSENITDIKNTDVNDDEVQLLTSLLFQESSKEMRSVNTVNKLQENNMEVIKGNKILRLNTSSIRMYYPFKLSTISTWLLDEENNDLVSWNEGALGTNIITWPCYSTKINDTSTTSAIEYRMLQGNFKLSNEQLELLKSEKVQAILGVSTDDEKGFETIIPFNDLICIFINSQITPIHYRTTLNSNSFGFSLINEKDTKFTKYEYFDTKPSSDKRYCNEERHKELSSYMNNNHIDLNTLNQSSNKGHYSTKNNLKDIICNSNKEDNKIQILMGQHVRSEKNSEGILGGISKLDLFLIENPQFKVNIKPYFIKEEEKVYVDADYSFSCGEQIYYDIEIINVGESFSLDNVNLQINFVVNEKNSQNKIKDTLKISKENITYRNNDITKDVEIFISHDNKELGSLSSISELDRIETGDKITISSKDIDYIVTEYNSTKNIIEYDYTFECNYLDEYLLYKYDGSGKFGVKELKGSIDITVECQDACSDFFYVKIFGQDSSSNVKLKNKEKFRLDGLDLNKTYKVSLINDCTHKSITEETVTLSNKINESSKSIILKTSDKRNNFFVQRKIESTHIDR